MKNLVILFTFILSLTVFNLAHAKNEFFNSNITIKELKKNIDKLKEDKLELKNKFKSLSTEYWNLSDFMRSDLTYSEKKDIQKKIEDYISIRNKLEKELKIKIENLEDSKKIKDKLLIERINFYKSLVKYIDKTKKELYIEHIKFNLLSIKENKDLAEEIYKNENLLWKKVKFLKEKIENHKKELNLRLENTIKDKIWQKIDEIMNNKDLLNIDKETKLNLYNEIINKLNEKIKNIDISKLDTNIKNMKIFIYTSMIEKFNQFIK